MSKAKKILGSISPLAGAITGEGLFGKGLVAVGDALGPVAGLMPMGASQMEKRRERKKAGREADEAFDQGMRKGGKVKKMAKGGSASKRADGCATKGKTKGRFV